MATLIVLQGPDKGRTLKATDEHVLIGRGSDQMPLTDSSVSRRHAELRRNEAGWQLVDLGSANGTYLNGVRLNGAARLKHGDQLRLGSTLLVYTGDERVEELTGPSIPRDMVLLDAGSHEADAAIMAAVPSSEDSVVLAAPETAYAVKGWNMLRQLTDVSSGLLPKDKLLARVLDVISEEVDVERGVILMREREEDDLVPEAIKIRARGVDDLRAASSIIASRTIVQHVLEASEGVLCSNVVADKRFGSGKSVQNLGMRSIICCPIVARERVLGVIYLDCSVQRHIYNEHELKLVTAVGAQAGLSVENAQLVRQHLQQERLAAAGETVAYLSHYIKNVLQGMRSGADVLERGLKKRDLGITEEGWRIVERNLDKSYSLMLNMLAFSKPREPKFEMLQVNRIIEHVVADVQRQADDAGVMLLADLDENVPPTPVDHDGVHQVVLNLVTNAIEAVERGKGVINVRTNFEVRQREVVIIVADNGPGIPPEKHVHVFEPFYSSKGHAGTGLGLAVARKIVQEMNGAIELWNPPDGGAEFRVRLPASLPEQRSAHDTLGPGG